MPLISRLFELTLQCGSILRYVWAWCRVEGECKALLRVGMLKILNVSECSEVQRKCVRLIFCRILHCCLWHFGLVVRSIFRGVLASSVFELGSVLAI